jgi:nucleoside 2-deoxyribosyltransferase
MQAYISISYDTRKQSDPIIKTIADALQQSNFTPFVFGDNYSFDLSQERQMMRQAFADIDNSGLLIAEVSEKAIGIGVEVGYALAKGIPVIYIRRATAEHSTTVSGASDFQIVYHDAHELTQKLRKVLETIQ